MLTSFVGRLQQQVDRVEGEDRHGNQEDSAKRDQDVRTLPDGSASMEDERTLISSISRTPPCMILLKWR